MKCRACDDVLTDAEATVKHPQTQEYVDLCSKCGGIVAADLAEDGVESIPAEDELLNEVDIGVIDYYHQGE